MGTPILVLDSGYVELIEAWGCGAQGPRPGQDPDYEIGIIAAARQSTQGSFRGWEEDEPLLSTLYHHQPDQSTPFEAAGMTVEVQAPIMVFREWHRHRTQSYNEASGRYIQLPPLYYHVHPVDVIERAIVAAKAKNKQAGNVAPVDSDRIARWVDRDRNLAQILEDHYQEGLAAGVPKELARKKMPVDHYSRMRATANLRNWLRFLTLRLDQKAQWEIRQYAEAVATIVQHTFPRTWKLFEESRGS